MPNEISINAKASARRAEPVQLRSDIQERPELALFALDHAADAVFMFGRDTRFFYVNERAVELLGYSRDELLDLTAPDIDPAFPGRCWKAAWTRMRRRRAATFESRHRRKDGSTLPVEVAANFVELDGHEYICAFVRDVTSRREDEERFRNLVEGSLQGISVDAYDNRPLFVNQAYAELYGYDSPEEIMQLESLQHLVHPEDRGRIEDYTRRRKRGDPVPSLYDFRAFKKDGTPITVLCSAKKVIWKGNPSVQATLLDITDRLRILDAERAQQAERRRLVGAMETAFEGFALFDQEDRLYYCNRRYRELVCAVEDILVPGTSFREIAAESVRRGAIPAAAGREEDWVEQRLNKHHRPTDSIELYRADSGAWVRINEQQLPDGDTFVVVSDITRLKESEQELADTTSQLQTAYDNMDQGIVMLDKELRVAAFNKRFVELISLPDLEIEVGVPVVDVYRCFAEHGGYGAGDVEELVARRIQRLRDGHAYRFVVECLDGRFLEVRGRPLPDVGHVVTYTDVTETHQLSRKLSYQASHDALTGLANRSFFETRLQALLATAREGAEHALCYVDLDQFKVINDTCGHLAGDELLRQLGGILPEQVRHQDTLARLGGDEFGLLLENCGIEDAAAIAEKIRHAIETYRFVWGAKLFRVGSSVGVVPINHYSEGVSDLMSDADTACYAAKDQGGNRVHVYHADDAEMARRRGDMQWVAGINRSLERNDLVLFEQPIRNLADRDDPRRRREILLRLKDAAGNLIEPKTFLRSAERFGLMLKLDHWVVSSMLDWLASAPAEANVHTTFFINLSGISLREDAFRSYVLERLADVQTSRYRICFEVTETAAVASLSNAAAFIERVRELGHQFALDDFGSGLSSLAYLRNLPVDYLKIDGQFVRDITRDPIDLAMVKSITEIARVMDKQTIAEYAETAPVVERLEKIGVDFAQGYAIGYPRPLTKDQA